MGGWKDCHGSHRVESNTCRCVNWVLLSLPPQNPASSSPPVSLRAVAEAVHFPYTLTYDSRLTSTTLGWSKLPLVLIYLSGNSIDQDACSFTTREEPNTPYDMIRDLRHGVDAVELPKGTESSLTASLDVSMNVLSDSDPENYVAAINVLIAFVHKVEPQRDTKITNEVADELIARSQESIAELSAGDMVPQKDFSKEGKQYG